jgi:hypothetical protein
MMFTASGRPCSSLTTVAFVSSQYPRPDTRSMLRVSSGSATSPSTARRPGRSSIATGLPSSRVM